MLDGHRDPAFAWDWTEARSTQSLYTFDPFQPFQLNTPSVRSSVPSHRPHWWGLSCLTSGFSRGLGKLATDQKQIHLEAMKRPFVFGAEPGVGAGQFAQP